MLRDSRTVQPGRGKYSNMTCCMVFTIALAPLPQASPGGGPCIRVYMLFRFWLCILYQVLLYFDVFFRVRVGIAGVPACRFSTATGSLGEGGSPP